MAQRVREHSHFSSLFFFFLPRPPPQGGDSKRSTGHELIEHSTIQSASRVTLAPQTTKRQKNWWARAQKKRVRNGRPVWSAVHVVQVHIGSNGLLAKHLEGWGSRPGAWNPICTARSSGAGKALLCLERHLRREENTSSVVSMPSGAVETQWQVPAVEAIFRTIMVLLCLGPMKAPRAGVRGRVVWTSRFRRPGNRGVLGGTPPPAGS